MNAFINPFNISQFEPEGLFGMQEEFIKVGKVRIFA